jgi:L-ectoine synthase
MIVRNIKDIIGSEREVHAKDGQWVSRRMLLKGDNMGFSFHETIIKKAVL